MLLVTTQLVSRPSRGGVGNPQLGHPETSGETRRLGSTGKATLQLLAMAGSCALDALRYTDSLVVAWRWLPCCWLPCCWPAWWSSATNIHTRNRKEGQGAGAASLSLNFRGSLQLISPRWLSCLDLKLYQGANSGYLMMILMAIMVKDVNT